MSKGKKPQPAPKQTPRGAAARSAAGEKLGGRPKGSVNKVTKAVKEAALGALNAGEGAEAFFMERKEANPDAFMGFLKAIVPHEVALGGPNGENLFGPDQIIKAAAELVAARNRK